MRHDPQLARGASASVSLAELVGAFSYALDITEGQPAGHCVRACWIGSNIGRALGLSATERHDLYYTLLLKDLGCSSNAARICELYETGDRALKQGHKTIGPTVVRLPGAKHCPSWNWKSAAPSMPSVSRRCAPALEPTEPSSSMFGALRNRMGGGPNRRVSRLAT